MDKKKKIIIGSALLGIVILYMILGGTDSQKSLTATVQKDSFQVLVVTSGELEAINSVEIHGPKSMRSVGVYNASISELIPEGTVVKEGDFVAKIDPSELSTKLSQAVDELNKAKSKFLQAKLDTALNLSKDRETIKDLKYNVSERKIELEQSKFEPPATVRLAEMAFIKAKEKLEKEHENYDLNYRKALAEIQEAAADLNIAQSNVNHYEAVMDEFTILAPKGGMLVYHKSWDGSKITEGSKISAWNSIVARLPDLSEMVSITYVNEVDIRKIKVGQKVLVSLDAFPEKQLNGEVIEVANMGENISGSDAKVFNVQVKLEKVDGEVRPGMTTGNKIITYENENTLILPLEALFTESDSIYYVYQSSGLSYKKVEVEIGLSNENFVELINGLSEGDEVLLSEPENASDLMINRLNP